MTLTGRTSTRPQRRPASAESVRRPEVALHGTVATPGRTPIVDVPGVRDPGDVHEWTDRLPPGPGHVAVSAESRMATSARFFVSANTGRSEGV